MLIIRKVIKPSCVITRKMMSTSTSVEGLDVEKKNSVLWLKFNRPSKLNAISLDIYKTITHQLEQVNQDKSVKAVVLTGVGDFYSSGNDLTNFLDCAKHSDGLAAGLKTAMNVLIKFVDSFINLEKFLIAAVNGPAIGIPVTTLALCDYVLASDKATFQTPFTALGQCAEACSSYTFPALMGTSRANELLCLNKTFDAEKAQAYGLVAQVVDHAKFSQALDELLEGRQGLQACYPGAMMINKSLIRSAELKKKLSSVNRIESETLYNCWQSEECQDALQKFMKRAKKL